MPSYHTELLFGLKSSLPYRRLEISIFAYQSIYDINIAYYYRILYILFIIIHIRLRLEFWAILNMDWIHLVAFQCSYLLEACTCPWNIYPYNWNCGFSLFICFDILHQFTGRRSFWRSWTQIKYRCVSPSVSKLLLFLSGHIELQLMIITFYEISFLYRLAIPTAC